MTEGSPESQYRCETCEMFYRHPKFSEAKLCPFGYYQYDLLISTRRTGCLAHSAIAARKQGPGKHPMKCNLVDLCKFAEWTMDPNDPNSEWHCSTPNCKYRNNFDTRHTGESPICKICKSGKQEPFCIGCERLLDHDAAIREDERNKVLNAVRDACSKRMSEKNPEISGVMLSYILADLRPPAPGNRTDSAEQRIADVIVELEKRAAHAKEGEHSRDSFTLEWKKEREAYEEAIYLLKNGVKKDGE